MKNLLFIFIILFVCFFHCNAQSKREAIMVKFVESANKSDCNAVIRYGKELYKLNPKDDNVLQIMAVAYFESGKTDSAFYCASEAIKQNPDNYYALVTLGDICFAIKDYEKAEVFYSKVLDLAPGYARAYLNLAKLYETSQPRRTYVARFGCVRLPYNTANFLTALIIRAILLSTPTGGGERMLHSTPKK